MQLIECSKNLKIEKELQFFTYSRNDNKQFFHDFMFHVVCSLHIILIFLYTHV
jgi:hypothetical protein